MAAIPWIHKLSVTERGVYAVSAWERQSGLDDSNALPFRPRKRAEARASGGGPGRPYFGALLLWSREGGRVRAERPADLSIFIDWRR